MTLAIPDAAGEVRLTRQGRRHLGARARNLRDTIIPGLVELRDGSDRDDSVLADHERATTELARICTVLATARPVEALPDDPDVVELGEAVTISLDGAPAERWVIVHPSEAALGAGRTSAHSPLGRALLGRRVGDKVEVAAPGGTYRCVIESATRTKTDRLMESLQTATARPSRTRPGRSGAGPRTDPTTGLLLASAPTRPSSLTNPEAAS